VPGCQPGLRGEPLPARTHGHPLALGGDAPRWRRLHCRLALPRRDRASTGALLNDRSPLPDHMTTPPPPTSARRPRIGLPLIIMGVVLLALFVVPSLVRLATDWLWFREAGYDIVFTRSLTARWGLGLGAFAVAFAVLYGSLRTAQRGIVLDPVVVRLEQFAP